MAIDENDPVMKAHFEAAGIVDEAPAGEASQGGEGNDSVQGQTEDKVDSQSGTEEKPNDGNKQAAPAKASTGDADDGGKKSGQEEKGKSASNPNDLKAADGTVIARAGPERRFYEQLQTAKQQVAAQERNLATTKQEVEQLRTQLTQAQESIKAIGAIDAPSAQNALRLYNDLRQNPVGTITSLLAELKKQGHNIEGIGSAVDTQAIQRLIDERIPRNDSGNGRPTQEQIDREAEQEVATFFATYPDAVTHDAILADVVTKNPNLSIETAYFQLKQSAQARGLDWSQPLIPQIQAQVAAQNGQQQQGSSGAKPTTPMIEGRGGAAAAVVEKDPVLDPTTQGETYDDIIRDELRKAGIARQ